MFDSLINRNEYYSNHYLDVLIQNDLAGLRSAWDKADQRGEATARTRIRGLGRPYFTAKTIAAQRAVPDPDDIRAIHDSVLIALGFTPDRSPRPFTRGDARIDVPLAAFCDTHTGLLLVALDAGLAADVDQVLDNDRHAPGALLSPIGADRPVREQVTAVADAVSLLFATEEAPRYVLVLAGGIVVLADRNAWGEGRFLAADIDLALSRNDTKAKGELETIAALFSADALIADGGPSIADTLAAASQKHAVGVSKDLRDGIRMSVELLANEVITQRLAANQAVYNIDGLARDLTRQCLRFLYRLLFLLYAEARPELQIVPKDHPEYDEGYGLDRLRDLALTPLNTDRARDGSHLHESLKLLFRLVNDGHGHKSAARSLFGASEGIGLRFEPLRSELFDPKATPLLDSVGLRNDVLQQVLRLLMLSREAKGKARGFVSYANLGINQLGAVYEGLMAYTGFFATDDLNEVSLPDAADKGTWVLPVAQLVDLPADVFVTRVHSETGASVRVLHRKGSFVFRLSGRDRQRSASYYTPEVLTRCVVRHALAELLDQNETTTPASHILELSICEPALGSGAFLNEAINQLAAEYLRRRQAELGKTIEPEAYPAEFQKVKAHLALHRCYGVDLNATAVELAEVSLWLNATYPGLQAPWFGLHLRRGNSLIGARRATYTRTQLTKAAWLTAAPTDRKLADGPIGDGDIHHFLLPAAGWGAVADSKQAKELRPTNTARLKAWRKSVQRAPVANDIRRLAALSRRAETLWTQAAQRVRLAESDLRRPIPVWGADPKVGPMWPLSRAAVEDVLRDCGSPLGRLRLVMDAWCALWFWPIDGPIGIPDPPVFVKWLDALEGILGVQPLEAHIGQLALFDPADLDALVERDRQLQFEWGMRAIEDVVAEHPWLSEVRRIADREGFWHWELEFAPVFQRGGFDLQVGNPPWVRPTWQDDVSLAEFDPWFGVTHNPPVAQFADRRAEALAPPQNQLLYLADVASSAGLNEHLGSPSLHPLLSGLQTNLYMVFMTTVWRHSRLGGVASLLHPESHFTDPAGGALRQETYGRLRRQWDFKNVDRLFEEVHHLTYFSVAVYSNPHETEFMFASHIFNPETLELSLTHDGSGEVPTIQYPAGGWDYRPHASRVFTIDNEVLASWAKLFDEPGTPAVQARLLRPVTRVDLEALEVLANQPTRLANHSYHWTTGFHEKGAKDAGIIRRETLIPQSWAEVILQGPHFTVATPFAKQPNEGCKHNQDYSTWDLEVLPERVIPRTNYQRACDRMTYDGAIDQWDGRPATSFWRHIHREMTQPGLARSLHGCVIPPGPTNTGSVAQILETNRLTAIWSGLLSSIPYDYLVKVSGLAHIKDYLARRMPFPADKAEYIPLLLRVLRLNCLTAEYAPLWEELFDVSWRDDSWTDPTSDRPSLGDVGAAWTMATPLRMDVDRRMALVEVDALAALTLDLTAEQLCGMYRTQFAVLRKYEFEMWFDSNGRKVRPDVIKAWRADQRGADLGRFVKPFSQPDREKEMTWAYEEFRRRLGTECQ